MILLTILKVIFCSSVMYWYILCDVSSCICFQLGMSDWALWVWNTYDFVIVIIASHWPPSDTERVDPSCDSSVADDLVSLGLKPPWVVVVVVWGGGGWILWPHGSMIDPASQSRFLNVFLRVWGSDHIMSFPLSSGLFFKWIFELFLEGELATVLLATYFYLCCFIEETW